MTTPLFLLRCVELGLSMDDLDHLTVGMITEMFHEKGRDSIKFAYEANQADFDAF